YRAIFIAGPSEKGQELAEKVNDGDELTWDDLNSANWSVIGSSSSAGYIYPVLWLLDNYDKSITDLDNVVQSDSYGSSFARLAAGQTVIVVAYADARLDYEDDWESKFEGEGTIWEDTNLVVVNHVIYCDSYGSSFARLAAVQSDIVVHYADARLDYEDDWESKFEGEGTIWEDTNLVGVTQGIYNDTVSVSQNSDIMDEDLKEALQKAFINIAETDEGKEVIDIYSHEGYQEADSDDYDGERDAQELIREMK